MVYLFFVANLPLRNLALFSFFFALSTPLYWFNFGGVENLILLVTLVELHLYRMRGYLRHYVFALVFIGIAPLIKLSACVIAASGLAGFLADRVMRDGWNAKREITLALLVPAAVAGGLAAAALSGWQGLSLYLRASADLIGGYTAAMSSDGPSRELVAAVVVLAVLVHLLWLQSRDNPGWARFSLCNPSPGLSCCPSNTASHAKDIHVTSYFGFVALAAALISLKIPIERRRALALGLAVELFVVFWVLVAFPNLGGGTIGIVSGLRNAEMAWNACIQRNCARAWRPQPAISTRHR